MDVPLPLPIQDGWSLLTGCRTRAEVAELLAAFFREIGVLADVTARDYREFGEACARVLPEDEAALVTESDLELILRAAVRQLLAEHATLKAVKDKSWELAAVDGNDKPVAQAAEVVLASREERLRTLQAHGGLAAVIAERLNEYYRALQEAPPGGRELHPEFWPGDRGMDGHRSGRT